MRQRWLNLAEVRRVVAKRMFMADRFCLPLFSDFACKPCACIFSARFAGESWTPRAEIFFQHPLLYLEEIANINNANIIEPRLGDLAHSGNFADIQGCKKTLLLPGEHIQHAIGLGFI